MTALCFELKINPEFALDVSPLTSKHLGTLSLQQIKAVKLNYGNQRVPITSLFKIKGKNPNHIIINNSTKLVHYVGKSMESGTIEVTGDVGRFLGQGMSDGRIIVKGNSGEWTGNRMCGGYINIFGDAGDYVGGSLPGDPFGMNRGFINILGDAGDCIGDRMRRGMIVVHGKANDFCGCRMHAGTIIALKGAGKNTGTGMRRGSLILAKKPLHYSASFTSSGYLEIQFLHLLFTQLANLGGEFSVFNDFFPTAHRLLGDRARNGKGEILILKTNNPRLSKRLR